MKNYFLVTMAALVFAISCNTSETENGEEQAVSAPVGKGSPVPDTVSSVPATDAGSVVPAPPPIQLAPAAAASANSANVAVNPPHGQPGHRCDISVGAPLPQAGAAAATMPQAKQVQPATVVTPTSPAPVVTPANPVPIAPVSSAPVGVGKGKNPPHGQPGHRCDIAVGAPLD